MGIGTILSAIGLLKDLAPSVSKVAERFIDGKATEKELDHEANKYELDAEVKLALAQIKLNTNEAKSTNVFVAGWRPMVGWICAIAFGYHFMIAPIAIWVIAFYHPEVTLPVLDTGPLFTVLLGMLGIGGFRTYEKLNGLGKSPGK